MTDETYAASRARPLLTCLVLVSLSALLSPWISGCSRQRAESPPAPPQTSSTARPAASAEQRALEAKDELFKRLSTRLVAAMSSGGPSAAIQVCRQEAPKIADAVGQQYQLAIGRTSFKLRNPANAPPEWATEFIERRETEPQLVALAEGKTGALFPIHLQTQCLVCHGPAEMLAEDVRRELAALYPQDQATGFQEGDLRGWFWVEVPDEG
jgi:mono/diheme cytochrome c family protein